MKVQSVKSFSHPLDEAAEWKAEEFRPLRDHKVKIELDDGSVIESGIFEIITNGKSEVHACISTQAGCKFGCHFCSSGRNGFQRNLSHHEILQEISTLAEIGGRRAFDRVMYMGIGEPLDNFDNVVESITQLLDRFPSYHQNISLATIGIIPRLKELALLRLPLRMIWVSLHAAFDEKRSKIMPIGKSSKIKEVVSAANSFAKMSATGTWINYMILRDFNDQKEDAVMLADLLSGTEDSLSIMITTPNGAVPGYTSGTKQDVYRFQKLLVQEGVQNRTVRFFAVGQPVNACCGEFIFCPAENLKVRKRVYK